MRESSEALEPRPMKYIVHHGTELIGHKGRAILGCRLLAEKNLSGSTDKAAISQNKAQRDETSTKL